MGIGVTTPNTLAQLQVQSTSKGMLVPRMTLAQRNSISIPGDADADGLLIYQTDETPGFYYYNGSAWVLISNNLVVKNGGANFTNSLLIGHQTTGSLSGAVRNLGIGEETLKSITSGYYNLAIGMSSLGKNTTGYYNLGVGTLSLSNMTTGNNNVAVGAGSLFRNTDGYYNTAVGNSALYSSVNGALNTAVGMNALYFNTGYQNVAIGYYAGYNLTTGTNNIMIGYDAQPSSPDAVNEVTIGNSNNSSYRIFASGWTNASDAAYKHDISDLPAGLDFVKRLRPVEFVYNHSSKEEKSYGFIAQEVRDAVEEQGLERSGLVQNMDASHLGLKTTELIPVLTKAIQEQQRQIEEQKREIESLKRLMGKRRGRRGV